MTARRRRLAIGLAFASFTAGLTGAGSAEDRETTRITVQLMNPTSSAIRVVLDGREVALVPPLPRPSPPTDTWPPPRTIGEFDLEPGGRHQLSAHALSSDLRAELLFPVGPEDRWIVIWYHAGRETPREPPTVSFSIQAGPRVGR